MENLALLYAHLPGDKYLNDQSFCSCGKIAHYIQKRYISFSWNVLPPFSRYVSSANVSLTCYYGCNLYRKYDSRSLLLLSTYQKLESNYMHNLQGIMHNSLFRVNFNISRISVTNILGLKLTGIKDIVMTLVFLYQLL